MAVPGSLTRQSTACTTHALARYFRYTQRNASHGGAVPLAGLVSAIVEAVERLAIARGWLGTRGREYAPDNQPPWIVHIPPAPLTHVSIGSVICWTTTHGADGWHVDPLTALLWSLLVGLDVAPVDVGACPACVKRGSRSTTFRTVDFEPCATCSVDGKPTGRDLRHPARLLLDASHEWGVVSEEGAGGTIIGDDLKPRPAVAGDPVCIPNGDAEARAHLAVLADLWHDGRATHAVEVAIPSKWAPHDLGPTPVVVWCDGRVGSIRRTPHGAQVKTTASGPCEVLVEEATAQVEARPLRVQARWLVSWLLGWPGDSREVCGSEMAAVAAKIWKRLTVPCRRCPGPMWDRNGVYADNCSHCDDRGRVPDLQGERPERRTVVAEWGSQRAATLIRVQSAGEHVTIDGLEYAVTSYSVDHTGRPDSHGLVTFELVRFRRVTTSTVFGGASDIDGLQPIE